MLRWHNLACIGIGWGLGMYFYDNVILEMPVAVAQTDPRRLGVMGRPPEKLVKPEPNIDATLQRFARRIEALEFQVKQMQAESLLVQLPSPDELSRVGRYLVQMGNERAAMNMGFPLEPPFPLDAPLPPVMLPLPPSERIIPLPPYDRKPWPPADAIDPKHNVWGPPADEIIPQKPVEPVEEELPLP